MQNDSGNILHLHTSGPDPGVQSLVPPKSREIEDRFIWTYRSLNGNENAKGHTIQLFESKEVTKIKEAPGYHFCKNESGTHLAPVPDVSSPENRSNMIETI